MVDWCGKWSIWTHPGRGGGQQPNLLPYRQGTGMTTTIDLYGGVDPRELPAYSFWDVALSLRLPVSTLRAWTRGQPGFQPLFDIPSGSRGLFELSFYNLIESYVIVQLRRKHGLPMRKVR